MEFGNSFVQIMTHRSYEVRFVYITTLLFTFQAHSLYILNF